MPNIENEKAALVSLLQPYLIVDNVEALVGGLSNLCMKVTDDSGKSYVWRPNGHSTDAFGLNRATEYEALTFASKVGIASAPAYLLDEGLLNPWVDGEMLQSAEFDLTARLLADVHALPPMSLHFDPFVKGAYYYSQLTPSSVDRSISQIHTYFQNHVFVSGLPLTTCHYDLGYYNVIRTPEGSVSLIDWEYAALGDPAMDIVMTSLANGFELETLVDRYCQIKGIADKERWLMHCQRWLPVADYLGVLWYALGYELYGLDIYKERKHFFQRKVEDYIQNHP
ncbi:phosphotransferase [Enterovibrio nigricans]|uniref:Thiamine kinase n=1 Tax=Enterovibrio nigricans DSM 22720 TaxID=1121868 RepID=A0A1T4UQX8_9GAMM|nr:phosphotransferase [Enterovibrio nigricans]PKF51052.1 thiamine kinase [Enterovibrio nigricans]SKA54821.1 thiamine kinase [Enterovibrio nigricans DSM 22720]